MSEPSDLTIILAAGKSTRIAELSFDRPKTLLSVCGQSLLTRLCLQLAPTTERFVIVAGAHHALLDEHLAGLDLPIEFITDERLSECGNAASLTAGLKFLNARHRACHIVESDVVLSQEALDAYKKEAFRSGTLTITASHTSDDKLYRLPGSERLAVSKAPPAGATVVGKFLGVTRLLRAAAQRLAESIPEHSPAPYIDYLSPLLAEIDGFIPIPISEEMGAEVDTASDYRKVLLSLPLARAVRQGAERQRNRTEFRLGGALKRLVGVHDGIGARLGQRSGFDGLWLGSFQIALAAGGRDDASYDPAVALDLAEQLRSTGADLPLVVDIGNGFRDGAAERAFVERAASVHVSAICVEDNAGERVCSLYGEEGRTLISPEAFADRVGSLEDAAAGRMMVIARTEALTLGFPAAEAAARLHAAARAGAGALLPHYVGSDARVIRSFLTQHRFPCPVLLVPTGLLHMPINEFKAMGCAAIVYANLDLRLRFQLLQDVYARLSAEAVLAPEVQAGLADPGQMRAVLEE